MGDIRDQDPVIPEGPSSAPFVQTPETAPSERRSKPDPTQPFEQTPAEAQEILRKPIKDLGLKIEGSPVEDYVLQLYRELAKAGLQHFRPACYLTDEWGCPSEEPVIGIPFYLADRRIGAFERAANDMEEEPEIMMYMRHEAGHAYNYAYEFYKTAEWRETFGPFRRPYRDEYRFTPFSKQYVRHIAGWYAQKHPDEDFAETFAVWMTPGSNWRKKYASWGAIKKLEYVDRISRNSADKHPVRPLGEIDFDVGAMEATVEEFYRENIVDEEEAISHLALDTDLADIFSLPARGPDGMKPAAELIAIRRRELIDKVYYWTGVKRPLLKHLIESIERSVAEQGLLFDPKRVDAELIELTVYVTSLAMTHLTQGKLIRT
ncbi:MAG TPA: putative zinc-binding metallopeptidase [Thermoanaerobaculia bacterium]|nr:putative zinc-binding metallopeptidase [Thermoanaerobaculia bacterium]